MVYIERDPEYDGELTAEGVREYLEGKVSRQALPSRVRFVESIPLTGVGKTDKVALRERETN